MRILIESKFGEKLSQHSVKSALHYRSAVNLYHLASVHLSRTVHELNEICYTKSNRYHLKGSNKLGRKKAALVQFRIIYICPINKLTLLSEDTIRK